MKNTTCNQFSGFYFCFPLPHFWRLKTLQKHLFFEFSFLSLFFGDISSLKIKGWHLDNVEFSLDFCCSQCVPITLSLCSQLFPPLCSQCVPKHFPKKTTLECISFALISTLVIYILSPKGGDHNLSILGLSKARLIPKIENHGYES